MRRSVIAMLGLALASCNGGGGGGGGGGTTSADEKNGFGADLLKELEGSSAGSGSGAAVASSDPAGSGSGSGSGAVVASTESVGSGPGSDRAAPVVEPAQVAQVAAPGSGSAAPTQLATAEPAQVASAEPANAGSAEPSQAKPVEATRASGPPAKITSFSKVSIISNHAAPPAPVSVPPEIAAIQFALGASWERDVYAPATLSFAAKLPGRSESALFVFRYGYEDASAPLDRDAYKKWLADNKVLAVRQDRQAGAAWYLEGTDGSGVPSFRVVVKWGGRLLVCYGSLYKDAESTKLGDLRDQTIIQAKQICESVAL
ncbi:MAG: hypothetical protein ACTHU0_05555 [Kofleriaceae bacterium]